MSQLSTPPSAPGIAPIPGVTPGPRDHPPDHTQPTPPTEGVGLTEAQLAELADARVRMKKITRAASVAAMSGWSMVVFAAISLPFGLFDFRTLVVSIALGTIAVIELRGCRLLRTIDVRAPRLLGFNQIALAVLIVVYACWGVVSVLNTPSPYAEHIAAGGTMAEMLEPIDQLNRLASIAFAILVGGFGLIGPPLTAWYYFSRRKHLRTFLTQTPEWVVRTIRVTR